MQQPGAVSDDVGAKRSLKAGKAATIKLKVPAALRLAADDGLSDGRTLLGQLGVEVTPKGGAAYDLAAQFVVATPGASDPFGSGPSIKTITLPKTVKPERKPLRYSVTVKGTQKSEWSFDDSSSQGFCTYFSRGSGTQELTFSTPKAGIVEHYFDRSGEPHLRSAGSARTGKVQVKLDAVRDSRNEMGTTSPECGSYGGDSPQQGCKTTGSRTVPLALDYIGNRPWVFISPTAWEGGESTEPNCPIETHPYMQDPLDFIQLTEKDLGAITRGGKPKQVIELFRETREDPVYAGGGTIKTTARLEIEFRRKR